MRIAVKMVDGLLWSWSRVLSRLSLAQLRSFAEALGTQNDVVLGRVNRHHPAKGLLRDDIRRQHWTRPPTRRGSRWDGFRQYVERRLLRQR